MLNHYRIVYPSLSGILSHQSLSYEGIERPPELVRLLDGPAGRFVYTDRGEQEQKMLEQYFHDLHGVFMKKFSQFLVESEIPADESLKLQAILQEMIKIKTLMSGTDHKEDYPL